MDEDRDMRAAQLTLRCLAHREGDEWHAFCIDFSLVACGATFDEARANLEAQIREYVYDALVGEDREHARALLSRRAPLGLVARYYWTAACDRLRRIGTFRRFEETMPLKPAHC